MTIHIWRSRKTGVCLSKCFISSSIKPKTTNFDNTLRLQNSNCSDTFVFWFSEQFAFWRHKMLSQHFDIKRNTCNSFKFIGVKIPNVNFQSIFAFSNRPLKFYYIAYYLPVINFIVTFTKNEYCSKYLC